jgi:hypothetical protein
MSSWHKCYTKEEILPQQFYLHNPYMDLTGTDSRSYVSGHKDLVYVILSVLYFILLLHDQDFDMFYFTEQQQRLERNHWMLMVWTGIASFVGEFEFVMSGKSYMSCSNIIIIVVLKE